MIPIISEWYRREWQLQDEVNLHSAVHSEADFPLQLVAFDGDKPVATGGIRHEVKLLQVKPEYRRFDPWLALLYTVTEYRGRGIMTNLLASLEKSALAAGVETLYLYTFTAAALYEKAGYTLIAREKAGDREAVIMSRRLVNQKP